MITLRELANAIRSKNAGPFVLSLDIMLKDQPSFQKAVQSGRINPESIHRLYNVLPDQVQIIPYPAALAIKITMPRPHPSGSFEDTDVLGAQQHAPLLDFVIEE
jgi:hypothetical protein